MNQNSNTTTKAYLEISLKINDADRGHAAGVYNNIRCPFLKV